MTLYWWGDHIAIGATLTVGLIHDLHKIYIFIEFWKLPTSAICVSYHQHCKEKKKAVWGGTILITDNTMYWWLMDMDYQQLNLLILSNTTKYHFRREDQVGQEDHLGVQVGQVDRVAHQIWVRSNLVAGSNSIGSTSCNATKKQKQNSVFMCYPFKFPSQYNRWRKREKTIPCKMHSHLNQ